MRLMMRRPRSADQAAHADLAEIEVDPSPQRRRAPCDKAPAPRPPRTVKTSPRRRARRASGARQNSRRRPGCAPRRHAMHRPSRATRRRCRPEQRRPGSATAISASCFQRLLAGLVQRRPALAVCPEPPARLRQQGGNAGAKLDLFDRRLSASAANLGERGQAPEIPRRRSRPAPCRRRASAPGGSGEIGQGTPPSPYPATRKPRRRASAPGASGRARPAESAWRPRIAFAAAPSRKTACR